MTYIPKEEYGTATKMVDHTDGEHKTKFEHGFQCESRHAFLLKEGKFRCRRKGCHKNSADAKVGRIFLFVTLLSFRQKVEMSWE